MREVTVDQISQEIKWFRETFAADLENLRAKCGSVEVKWGVVTWYM